VKAAGTFLSENLTTAKDFAEYVAPGELIVRQGLSKVAAYRGSLRILSGRAAYARGGWPTPRRCRLFRRIDALNFAMAHDDGQLPEDLSTADIIILGVSRTSKTPTSIYLAQRGYKTANLPLVPGIDLPPALTEPHSAFIVGLVASPERIAEIRRNRVRLMSDRNLDDYVDRTQIANEINYSRRLCARHGWPVIDVTRRSIEETAATIIRLLHDREEVKQSEPSGTEDA
jgi:hypothetical protein